MATLVGVFNTSHSPTTYQPAEKWNEVRASRSLRADVPIDDLEANRAKKARVETGFAALREKLAAVRPDALVIFGDDQLECFDFTNFPSFAVYVGESFEGPRIGGNGARFRSENRRSTAGIWETKEPYACSQIGLYTGKPRR